MSALADYGRAGLVGVLTPQANTTVEPEIWTLLPPGWSMINARLTSSKDSIEARLVWCIACCRIAGRFLPVAVCL